MGRKTGKETTHERRVCVGASLGQLWCLAVEEEAEPTKTPNRGLWSSGQRPQGARGRDPRGEEASLLQQWSPVPRAAQGQGSEESKMAIGFGDVEVTEELMTALVG